MKITKKRLKEVIEQEVEKEYKFTPLNIDGDMLAIPMHDALIKEFKRFEEWYYGEYGKRVKVSIEKVDKEGLYVWRKFLQSVVITKVNK